MPNNSLDHTDGQSCCQVELMNQICQTSLKNQNSLQPQSNTASRIYRYQDRSDRFTDHKGDANNQVCEKKSKYDVPHTIAIH